MEDAINDFNHPRGMKDCRHRCMDGKKFLIWERVAAIMGREGDMAVVGQIGFVDTRKPAIFFYEIAVRGSLHILAEKG